MRLFPLPIKRNPLIPTRRIRSRPDGRGAECLRGSSRSSNLLFIRERPSIETQRPDAVNLDRPNPAPKPRLASKGVDSSILLQGSLWARPGAEALLKPLLPKDYAYGNLAWLAIGEPAGDCWPVSSSTGQWTLENVAIPYYACFGWIFVIVRLNCGRGVAGPAAKRRRQI